MGLTHVNHQRRLAARTTIVGMGVVLSWQTLGAAAACAQEVPATTTSTTVASTSDAAGSYHPWPAMFLFVGSLLVIVMALLFAYFYHRRLLNSLDKALALGLPATVSNSEARSGGPEALEAAFEITGPAEVTTGTEAVYKASGYADGTTVSWTVEGDGNPDKTSDEGAEFKVTFTSSGTAKVVAKSEDLPDASIDVKVSAAQTESPGIVLPFVVKNWGGLVVTVLGVGVVAALMTMGVVSAEGGIGLLGALLGVGASTASAIPAATQPTPAVSPTAGPPSPGDSST